MKCIQARPCGVQELYITFSKFSSTSLYQISEPFSPILPLCFVSMTSISESVQPIQLLNKRPPLDLNHTLFLPFPVSPSLTHWRLRSLPILRKVCHRQHRSDRYSNSRLPFFYRTSFRREHIHLSRSLCLTKRTVRQIQVVGAIAEAKVGRTRRTPIYQSLARDRVWGHEVLC